MINKNSKLLFFRNFSFLILLFLEIFIGWKNLQYIKSAEYDASEPVAEWEWRFERLKKVLPITRGIMGYISDPDVSGYDYGPDDQLEYTLTQYTLAPIIIKKGANYEWNIGILSSSVYEDWAQSNNGEFEATFLKYNIYLIHRLNK